MTDSRQRDLTLSPALRRVIGGSSLNRGRKRKKEGNENECEGDESVWKCIETLVRTNISLIESEGFKENEIGMKF